MYVMILFLGFFMSACNHLFYYPDQQRYLTPERLGLDYQSNKVRTSDGILLDSWWLQAKPDDRRGETILHFHGNAQNMSSHVLYVAWLVEHGYDVVTFDYRGYGQSSQVSPNQQGLLLDACAILEWVVQHQGLDRNHAVYVLGQSLGGAVAIPALARCSSSKIRGLVVESTFSSYRDIAREKLASFWLTWLLQYPLSLLVSDIHPPKDDVAKLELPLLMMHSPEDPVVPYSLGRALYDQASEPKTWIDIDIPGHTTALIELAEGEPSPYRAKLLEILQKWSVDP